MYMDELLIVALNIILRKLDSNDLCDLIYLIQGTARTGKMRGAPEVRIGDNLSMIADLRRYIVWAFENKEAFNDG